MKYIMFKGYNDDEEKKVRVASEAEAEKKYKTWFKAMWAFYDAQRAFKDAETPEDKKKAEADMDAASTIADNASKEMWRRNN